MERQEPLDLFQQQNVQQQIARLLVAGLPAGWQQADVEFRAIGNHHEISWQVHAANGAALPWSPPSQLSAACARLRDGMRAPDTGTWFSMLLQIQAPNDYRSSFNYTAPPRWRDEPGPTDYALEQAQFPRDAAHTPDWFSLHGPRFREARIFDAVHRDQPPTVDRPPVPPAEISAVINYLDAAPAFLVQRGFGRDLIDGAEDVPGAFHTDGAWIWPADIAHYLRKHGVPPEPELVAHIRSRNFTVPAVDEATLLEAESTITGVTATAPPVEFRLTDDERKQLDVLRQRLDEHGVSRGAYLVRKHEDLFWCLERVESGWQVAYYENGQPVQPVVNERLADAAAYLLGTLLIDPARARTRAPKVKQTQAVLDEWPIQPKGGEPPLTLYADKRMIVLAAGTYVVRYGPPTGNLVFAEGTEFPAMSARPDRLEQGPRKYRVQRPLHVLTGTTVPWYDQPGGGTAYVLPLSIEKHLRAGSLAETQ